MGLKLRAGNRALKGERATFARNLDGVDDQAGVGNLAPLVGVIPEAAHIRD